jgi:hypothetical protein
MGLIFIKLIAETFSECKDLLSFFFPHDTQQKKKKQGCFIKQNAHLSELSSFSNTPLNFMLDMVVRPPTIRTDRLSNLIQHSEVIA